MRVAMIQMLVGEKEGENLEKARQMLQRAAAEGADLAVLPEMFCCPYQTDCFPRYAQPEGGAVHQFLAGMARELGIYLVGGSVPEKDGEGRVFNTAYAFDRAGRQVAKHRKMHLFDIAVEGGQHFRESDTLSSGDTVAVFETEFGAVGLEVCYDLRFPELARLLALRGARVLVVPAAFNMTTGPAHWELTFRARALDNQVFAVGVAPARDLTAGYISYANSIVTDPWGDVVARMGVEEGVQLAELDLSLVDRVRRQLPLLAQRRQDLYRLEGVGR